MTKDETEKYLEEQFPTLPPKLQKAARYVLNSPAEIAINSMRSSAAAANVQPAVMLRLARQLGFENYQTFRSCYADWVSNPAETLYKRAEALTLRTGSHYKQKLVAEILDTTVRNLGKALGEENAIKLSDAQKLITTAKRNYVLGVRSLFPAAYYLHYSCTTLYDNFVLLVGLGSTIADEIRRIDERDVLILFNFYPYSLITSQVAEFANERNVSIIAVTDSIVSPAARVSKICLLTPNTSPSMFPSIVPAMTIAETLAALLITAEKEKGLRQIEDVQAQLSRFNVFVER